MGTAIIENHILSGTAPITESIAEIETERYTVQPCTAGSPTLDIQNMSWVEDANRQVDFLIKQLHLKGTEKILDLACGFGRHSLEFARRGYDVTGIDITPAYIDYANEQAKKENLNAKFICQDIRTITFSEKIT